MAGLSGYGGITHVVVPRTENVRDMIVNRPESGIGDLPLFIVFGLSDVSHMDRHGDVHLLLVLLYPCGLFEKTGALISNVRPMLLCLLVPGIGVALCVRQNDQRKEIGGLCGSLIYRGGRVILSGCVDGGKQHQRTTKGYRF